MTFDYVLYEMSYANTLMYSSVLPSYDNSKEKDEEKFDPSKDANNPNLFKNLNEYTYKRK